MRLTSFSSRHHRRTINGMSCKTTSLPWTVSLEIAQRLLSDVGEFAAKIIATPDDELPEETELLLRGIAVQSLGVKTGTAANMTARALRVMLSAQFLAQVRNLDLIWYVRRAIIGRVTVDDRLIAEDSDLDVVGASLQDIVTILAWVLEINVHPTSAGRDTSDGVAEPAPSAQTIRGKSSVKKGAGKAGQ